MYARDIGHMLFPTGENGERGPTKKCGAIVGNDSP